MTIKKAVALLEKYHQQAENTNKVIPGFIKNPVAWALYQAWKEADKGAKKG
ncbi:MAG: hypothetical protein IJ153_11065 [Clostridia bacterium]|nr:hypothetical protein [Clostridia bacterium]MBQ9212227.1 hypothetical protein [Clostridia bacterium]